MSKGKGLFLGFIIGGIAGTVATLLTTPKNGNELRQTIKANSIKVKDALGTLKQESLQLKEQVVQASRESSIILKDFSKDVKISVEAWKKEIEPSKSHITDELKKIEESILQLEKITRKQEEEPN